MSGDGSGSEPLWWAVAGGCGLFGLVVLVRGAVLSGNGAVGRLLAAGTGVGLLAVADLAATGVLARTLGWLRWHEDGDRRIALRTYWFVPRKPHLRVDGALLTLALPGYFGRTTWTVPLDQVAVTDCEGDPLDHPAADVDEDDAVLVDEVRVPYFATTSSVTPTLLLLFRRPVRVPTLRKAAALSANPDVGFGYVESRRGVYVDGVLLRPVDPDAALIRLLAAGAERADDAWTWLRAHRRLSADPDERAEVTRRIGSARRLTRFAGAVYFLALTAALVLEFVDDVPTAAQFAPYAVVAGAWWLRRLARQVRQLPRQDGTAGEP